MCLKDDLCLVLCFAFIFLCIVVIDTNQNGVIEFNEFCDWFVEEMLDRPEEEGFLPQYVWITVACGCPTV